MTTTHTTKTLADELGVGEASVLVWLDQIAADPNRSASSTFPSTTGRLITVDGYERPADLVLLPGDEEAIREQAAAAGPSKVHLYDGETNEDLGPATPEQIAYGDDRALWATHGLFEIDTADGTPYFPGEASRARNAGRQTRKVYTL